MLTAASRDVAGARCGSALARHVAGGMLALILSASVEGNAWVSKLDGSATHSRDLPEGLRVSSDGNVVTVGSTQNSDGASDLSVLMVSGEDGELLWRRDFRGTDANGSNTGHAVELDAAGDVIATGVTVNDSTGQDLTVLKLAREDGAELWRFVLDGNAHLRDEARAVAIDASGNVVVAGISTSIDTGEDVTVVKLSGDDGREMWRFAASAPPEGGTSDDQAFAVAISAEGDVIVGGTIGSHFTVIELRGTDGEESWRFETLDVQGVPISVTAVALDSARNVLAVGAQFIVVKLDPDGSPIWETTLMENGDARAEAVATDPFGDVLAAGVLVSGETQASVVKLAAASGSELWRSGVGMGVNSLAVDDQGNVIAAGVRGPAGSPTGNDWAVVKVSGETGEEMWSLRLDGGANGADGAGEVAIDPQGAVVVGGSLVKPCSGRDIVLMKLDAETGAEMWTATFNGTRGGSLDSGSQVAVDASGDVLAVGTTENIGTCDDFTVAKLAGSNGQVVWRQLLRGTKEEGDRDRGLRVATDRSGATVAAGLVENEVTGSELTLVKLSASDGSESWRAPVRPISQMGAFSLSELLVDPLGDVFVAGGAGGEDPLRSDLAVAKFAGSDGERVWQREISGSASGFSIVNAATLRPDGLLAAAGVAENGTTGFDFVVLVLSSRDGVERWRRELDGESGSFDAAHAVKADSVGDVLAAGFTNGIGVGGAQAVDTDFTVVKLAGIDGAEMWRYVLEPPEVGGIAVATALAIDSVDDILAAGWVEIAPNRSAAILLKLDGGGAEIWTRTFSEDEPAISAIGIDAVGDVLAAIATSGPTGSDFSLWKMSGASGEPLWRRDIDGTRVGIAANDQALALAVDGAGDVVAVGSTDNAESGFDLTVVKLRGADGELAGTACPFDCDRDGTVTTGEFEMALHALFDITLLLDCAELDHDLDGRVSAHEVLVGIRTRALGCDPSATSDSRAPGDRELP